MISEYYKLYSKYQDVIYVFFRNNNIFIFENNAYKIKKGSFILRYSPNEWSKVQDMLNKKGIISVFVFPNNNLTEEDKLFIKSYIERVCLNYNLNKRSFIDFVTYAKEEINYLDLEGYSYALNYLNRIDLNNEHSYLFFKDFIKTYKVVYERN